MSTALGEQPQRRSRAKIQAACRGPQIQGAPAHPIRVLLPREKTRRGEAPLRVKSYNAHMTLQPGRPRLPDHSNKLIFMILPIHLGLKYSHSSAYTREEDASTLHQTAALEVLPCSRLAGRPGRISAPGRAVCANSSPQRSRSAARLERRARICALQGQRAARGPTARSCNHRLSGISRHTSPKDRPHCARPTITAGSGE